MSLIVFNAIRNIKFYTSWSWLQLIHLININAWVIIMEDIFVSNKDCKSNTSWLAEETCATPFNMVHIDKSVGTLVVYLKVKTTVDDSEAYTTFIHKG